MSTACLYTTVKNTSGIEKVFGFVGPHGVRLADCEQYSVPGNMITILGVYGGNGWSLRKFQAFERALEAAELKIVYTPSVFLYDSGTGETSVVALLNGTLGTADPCWQPSGYSDACPVT